jgi:hypothetical protein
MCGVSVQIFERTTAKSCKSRELILLSKIDRLKNRSFFRGDFKKLKYIGGSYLDLHYSFKG